MAEQKSILNILKFFTIFLFFFISCSTTQIKTPPDGITNKFFNKNTSELKDISNYDFSKLKKNYGLVIFSYEVTGLTGSSLTLEEKSKTGIRIWEKKFSDDGWEVYQEFKTIKLWETKTIGPNFNFSGPSLSTSTASVDVEITFMKNRIVYGGRLLASTIDNNFQVIQKFDDDCGAFMEKYKN